MVAYLTVIIPIDGGSNAPTWGGSRPGVGAPGAGAPVWGGSRPDWGSGPDNSLPWYPGLPGNALPGWERPVDPNWGINAPVRPGNALPGWERPSDPGYGRPDWVWGHPGNRPPWAPALPGHDLPWAPAHPGNRPPISGRPILPDNSLPGSPGHPGNWVPGSGRPARPDNSLPSGSIVYPSQPIYILNPDQPETPIYIPPGTPIVISPPIAETPGTKPVEPTDPTAAPKK